MIQDTAQRILPWGITLVLLAGAVLAAVAGAHTVSGSSTVQTSLPVLRWSSEGISDLYTLDPSRGPDFNSRQVMQLIFGGLVRFGPNFQILPDAASHWTVNSTGTVYTFYLRPNVRFADGTHLRAENVAYSLNRSLQPESGDHDWLTDIVGADDVISRRAATASGVRVVAPNVVQITLKQPNAYFLAKLANPAGYIVPRWRIDANPATWDQGAMGTGPFMVSRWSHGNALYLVPNPYYYGGKLRIAGIEIPFIPEQIDAYKRYQAGALDIMGTTHFPTEMLYDVQNHRDFHRSPRLETVFLTLNERQKPFNDERVREALARALNKEEIAQGVYGGFAHPTDGMMPPGLPGYNPNLLGLGYDPALARRLFAEAGYPGARHFPTITLPVDEDSQSILLAHALATQWHKVLGVRVRLIQHSHSDYIFLLRQLLFQVAVIDWTADYPDPENFVSVQLHSGSVNNNGGWHNSTFDFLVDRADAMPGDAPERFPLYQRAERIAMDDAATIPLVNPTAGILIRSGIKGFDVGGGYLLVRDWTRVTVPAGTQ